jgi:hypothetical protein
MTNSLTNAKNVVSSANSVSAYLGYYVDPAHVYPVLYDANSTVLVVGPKTYGPIYEGYIIMPFGFYYDLDAVKSYYGSSVGIKIGSLTMAVSNESATTPFNVTILKEVQ